MTEQTPAIATDLHYSENADLTRVATDVKHLALQNTRVKADLKALEDKVNNSGKFNMPLFISAMSLILGSLVVLGNMRLAPLEQNISSLAAHFQQHSIDGHPQTLTIKAQGTKREIELHLDHMRKRIEGLESD